VSDGMPDQMSGGCLPECRKESQYVSDKALMAGFGKGEGG
jgi:hypothetical protein